MPCVALVGIVSMTLGHAWRVLPPFQLAACYGLLVWTIVRKPDSEREARGEKKHWRKPKS